jgi:hypothetical protein
MTYSIFYVLIGWAIAEAAHHFTPTGQSGRGLGHGFILIVIFWPLFALYMLALALKSSNRAPRK